ncbi:MAG: hypothetical protein HQK54_02605 [Oligoflexales bacterium]|nr:hypothetical protein [Oligoflexales bacterium]
MNDLIKFLIRHTLIGIMWVFILSFSIDGRPIFIPANRVLVQNSLVRMIDEELSLLWYKITKTARVTFQELSNTRDKI